MTWTPERIAELGAVTTLRTAAEVLSIGQATAYELARRGEFPVKVLRVGTRYKVPTSGLLAYLGAERAMNGDDRATYEWLLAEARWYASERRFHYPAPWE